MSINYQNYQFPTPFKNAPLNILGSWGNYTGEALNKKNDKGQIINGNILTQLETIQPYVYRGNKFEADTYIRDMHFESFTVGSSAISTPMCILAIPSKTVLSDKLNSELEQREILNYTLKNYTGNPDFFYILIAEEQQAQILPLTNIRYARKQMIYIYKMIRNDDNFIKIDDYPTNKAYIPPVRYSTDDKCNVLSKLLDLGLWLENYNNNLPYKDEQAPKFDLKSIQTVTDFWNGEEERKIMGNNLVCIGINSYYQSNLALGRWAQSTLMNNTTIHTTIPIFNIDQQQDIYNYFSSGDISNALNIDDITLSDVNFATDWTIYVRGARNPDIYITMKSKGLDAFIENKKLNQGGLEKKDFKVEYRVPQYHYFMEYNREEVIKGAPVFIHNTPYNETYQTTWEEVQNLEKDPNSDPFPTVQSKGSIIPSELQFRIKYNNNLYSEWCYCDIGYIGSPSIDDFKYMDNKGGILNFDDGSTVTIIYDEYPPDIQDEYTDPDDTSNVTKDDLIPNSDYGVGLGLLTTTYKLRKSDVEELGEFLWNKTFLDNIHLFNNNPIENIVSMKVMPCAVSGSPSSIIVGNVDTKINGDIVSNVGIVDIGNFAFTGYYGNFLDYPPYTQAILFLPFIGFKEIDPTQFTNHVLSIKYVFDVVMGQCKALLFADGIYITSYDGTCGIDVPLIASNRAQIEASLVTSAVTSGFDAPTVISTFLHSKFHSERSGNYSSTLAWAETRTCFIVLVLPDAQYPTNYGHNVGYPCNLTAQLGSLSGFTVTDNNVDMQGFTCTDAEKQEILQYLTSGVYL